MPPSSASRAMPIGSPRDSLSGGTRFLDFAICAVVAVSSVGLLLLAWPC